MNNIITEIKNTLEGTNSRITEAEEQVSELEDRMVEIIAEEQNKGKRMKELRIASEHLGQYGTHKHSSYKGPRDMIGNNQVQEAQRVPYRINPINPRRDMLRYILIKLTEIKNKERILKAPRENP